MKKGELWLSDLPDQVGKEQVGKRPALIISDTKVGLIIIIPLTTNREALKYPHTLKIIPSEKNKLNKESIALIFQIRAIDHKRPVHKIGELDENYIEQINKNLQSLLNL